MNYLAIIFWILLFIVFYGYVGYGLVIWFINRMKKNKISGKKEKYTPTVTLLIAAYNELPYLKIPHQMN